MLRMGSRILGIVVNSVAGKGTGYGYHDGYYYAYGYGNRELEAQASDTDHSGDIATPDAA